MDDEELRRRLREYQDICMESGEIKEMLATEHTYSRRFQRKMKRLLWSRRNFGRDIHMGYMVRKVAAVAIVAVSLITVNQVSAHVWGVDAWNLVQSLVDGGRGVRIEYQKADKSDDDSPKAKYGIPQYVPDGYEQTMCQEDELKVFLEAEWQGKGEKQNIRYSRNVIIDGEVDVYDAEVDSRKTVQAAGIDVVLFYKRDEMGLIWHDAKYSYTLDSYIMDEKELIKMMESIYEKSDESDDDSPRAKHEIPQYVPDGCKQVQYQEDKSGIFLDAEWQGEGEDQNILYSRDLILDGEVAVYDAEVDSSKKIQAAGIDVFLCYDGNEDGEEMRLIWHDTKYSYIIQSYIMDEEKLVKMMESIYE